MRSPTNSGVTTALAATSLLMAIAVAAMNVRLLAQRIEADDADDNAPPAGSYDELIAHDRAHAARRRQRQGAAAVESAGADPPEVA